LVKSRPTPLLIVYSRLNFFRFHQSESRTQTSTPYRGPECKLHRAKDVGRGPGVEKVYRSRFWKKSDQSPEKGQPLTGYRWKGKTPKICQAPHLFTKVMPPHSTRLPPLYPQRVLAGFSAGLGILIIGGKKEISPLCSSESGEVVLCRLRARRAFLLGTAELFCVARSDANPAKRNGGG